MSAQASPFSRFETHVHLATSLCPTCDQPVPNEKLNEINAKHAERDRAIESNIRDQMNKDFSIRIEKIGEDAKTELQKAANENAALVEKLKQEAVERVEAVRKATENSYQQKLVHAQQLREAAETALNLAKQKAVEREEQVRAEADASWKTRFEDVSKAKEESESRISELLSNQQVRLDEQRSSLEKAKDEAVNIEKARAYEEQLKFQAQLADLQRKLEKTAADELGEGAEVKLLEDLRVHFEGDNFQHVGKGNSGADIIQEVVHNGQVCGKIIFDSKDRNAWRNEFVSKLLVDQAAAQAEHAILSSRVFPAGAKQVHIQDGVIIANPARVLTLVELLRKQIINSFRLRLSTESRVEKTAALYDFIGSEACLQLFNQIETQAAKMEDLDVAEQKSHANVWKNRGILIRGIQKAKGDLISRIDIILGSESNASSG